jgi:hypothetical protein
LREGIAKNEKKRVCFPQAMQKHAVQLHTSTKMHPKRLNLFCIVKYVHPVGFIQTHEEYIKTIPLTNKTNKQHIFSLKYAMDFKDKIFPSSNHLLVKGYLFCIFCKGVCFCIFCRPIFDWLQITFSFERIKNFRFFFRDFWT